MARSSGTSPPGFRRTPNYRQIYANRAITGARFWVRGSGLRFWGARVHGFESSAFVVRIAAVRRCFHAVRRKLHSAANPRETMTPLMLEIRKLRKSFGDLVAVDDVSFTVGAGELVGLLGPNGAGKTTTVSMITGLLKPDGGDVLLDGASLGGDTDPKKRRIGLVPQ